MNRTISLYDPVGVTSDLIQESKFVSIENITWHDHSEEKIRNDCISSLSRENRKIFFDFCQSSSLTIYSFLRVANTTENIESYLVEFKDFFLIQIDDLTFEEYLIFSFIILFPRYPIFDDSGKIVDSSPLNCLQEKNLERTQNLWWIFHLSNKRLCYLYSKYIYSLLRKKETNYAPFLLSDGISLARDFLYVFSFFHQLVSCSLNVLQKEELKEICREYFLGVVSRRNCPKKWKYFSDYLSFRISNLPGMKYMFLIFIAPIYNISYISF
jgi:hypothetical protein